MFNYNHTVTLIIATMISETDLKLAVVICTLNQFLV